MGQLGCTVDGNLNDSKFSEPMPWIGIYVAAAAAVCAIAMAADAFHGFRYRKLWFPCNFFSLNATTLTLIAVAIKFLVDLNTSMPHQQDQLAKLSSAAFICTAMGNFMPSLGTMENKELFMNIVALGILVITAIVNICIQLGTGVIYVFWREHAVVMFLMLVLLAILTSSAIAVPATKCYLELKYSEKHKIAKEECWDRTDLTAIDRLREGLTKYWMMAYTCSPQFVMGRSATCTASGAFCLLSAVTLAEAMLRSYLMPWSFKFCRGHSDYKWSTTLVLLTQTIAVGVGTIAPAFRWFTAINFRCPKRAKKACSPEFKVEKYWIKELLDLKQHPLTFTLCGRQGRKLVHNTKNHLLDVCIGMQSGLVLMSKSVRLVSLYFVSRFRICYRCCRKLTWLFKCSNAVSTDDSMSESQRSWELDLSRFVMHLEGEEELVHLMMENNFDATDRWIQMGKKEQPKHLMQLLERFKSSKEYKGVSEFNSDEVASLDSEEHPNFWALPVVTLTSIAVALPNIDNHLIEQLKSSVHQGLKYVRVVEDNLDVKRDLIRIRKAAEVVWVGVDLYHKWQDVDLRKMAHQEKSPKEILEKLADTAKNTVMEFRKKKLGRCPLDIPTRWHDKILAANSMYRVCRTILLDYGNRDCESCEILFERLSFMISDILGACLANLERVIPMQCHRSTIEEREESVRHAILLLGRTEEMLKIIDSESLPDSDPDQRARIDDQRLLSKKKDTARLESASADSNGSPFSSPDLCISID
ncbi:hypothetical protein RJ639_010389 [Escallonia herrerae]|uniref:Uncharacterized protein n=1 Tax=Escallonia herrerae TaxID=1293975 RepID=A0AA89AVP7_9ASTE|nr:hypothetical protein RJ639_010389 [Escallonia herrerae]